MSPGGQELYKNEVTFIFKGPYKEPFKLSFSTMLSSEFKELEGLQEEAPHVQSSDAIKS